MPLPSTAIPGGSFAVGFRAVSIFGVDCCSRLVIPHQALRGAFQQAAFTEPTHHEHRDLHARVLSHHSPDPEVL